MALSRAAAFAVALSVLAGNAFGQAPEVDLDLERSTNQQDWESVPLTRGMINPDGKIRLPGGTAASYGLGIEKAASFDSIMVVVEGGALPAVSGLGELNVDTFEIGQTPVTLGEWREVQNWAAVNGYDIGNIGGGCAADHPVHSVSWYDVVKWCNAKSEMKGLAPVYTVEGSVYRTGESISDYDTSANGFRLPEEAEWEFAARGGNQSNGYIYSGSNNIDEVGWYYYNSEGAPCNMASGRGTWPVGAKAANELGLFDMSGNVREWCWETGSQGFMRRVRGGGWTSAAAALEVSVREEVAYTHRNFAFGFRLARNLE